MQTRALKTELKGAGIEDKRRVPFRKRPAQEPTGSPVVAVSSAVDALVTGVTTVIALRCVATTAPVAARAPHVLGLLLALTAVLILVLRVSHDAPCFRWPHVR